MRFWLNAKENFVKGMCAAESRKRKKSRMYYAGGVEKKKVNNIVPVWKVHGSL